MMGGLHDQWGDDFAQGTSDQHLDTHVVAHIVPFSTNECYDIGIAQF